MFARLLLGGSIMASTRTLPRESDPDNPLAGIPTCNLCGDCYADAYWQGHDRVSVCSGCALDTLPALLADTVVGVRTVPRIMDRCKQALERFSMNYWRACAHAIDQAHRQDLVPTGASDDA